MSEVYDVVVVGGGPSGAVCAAHCARSGLRTVVLERSVFPREKVCGDCVNPGSWPILRRLELEERVRALPHAALTEVVFVDPRGRRLGCSLGKGEIAVKRSLLDDLLLTRAAELGAVVRTSTSVLKVRREGESWQVETDRGTYSSRYLVAADGRNSTVARQLDLLPPARKDRVGQQTHFPLPQGVEGRVVMQFRPEGYSGLADVGNGQANLCLVAMAAQLPPLKAWASQHFQLPENQEWRTITPLERAPVYADRAGLLLIGDAARVVEPFTGEGIYYALASGELAARMLQSGDLSKFPAAHARLYCGRLWVNLLAKTACLHPGWATAFLALAKVVPGLMPALTRWVTGRPT